MGTVSKFVCFEKVHTHPSAVMNRQEADNPHTRKQSSVEDSNRSDPQSTDASVEDILGRTGNTVPTVKTDRTALCTELDNMLPRYAASAFILAGREIIDRGNRRRTAAAQSFVQVFGTRLTIAAMIWLYIRKNIPAEARPNHLL